MWYSWGKKRLINATGKILTQFIQISKKFCYVHYDCLSDYLVYFCIQLPAFMGFELFDHCRQLIPYTHKVSDNT